MANLRKRQIKGTILLEALLALGVFAVIASLLLGQITQSRKEAAAILEKEEVLRVAQMALQTGQDHLSLNGIEIRIQRTKDQIRVFQAMTKLLASEIQYQEQTKAKEWLLFADQLDVELSRSHFEKVEQNKLYVKQDGKSIAFGKSKSDDFRKTDANGRGYQPMIYGLEAAQIHKEGQIVHLLLQFKDGLEREYIYRVEEEH